MHVHLISPEAVAEMREWALCCEWRDADEIEEMSDLKIIRGVNRHFDGGLCGFLQMFNA